jgi:hypothetical protein
MSDRRAGWLLVIVSGALGVMVTLLAYAMVFSRGALNGASSAGEAAMSFGLNGRPSMSQPERCPTSPRWNLKVRVTTASAAVSGSIADSTSGTANRSPAVSPTTKRITCDMLPSPKSLSRVTVVPGL